MPRRGKHLALQDLSFPALTEAREQVATALVDLCSGDPDLAARTLGRSTGSSTRRQWAERPAPVVNPASLAEQFTALGWKVELHEPGRKGQQLDVVVSEL